MESIITRRRVLKGSAAAGIVGLAGCTGGGGGGARTISHAVLMPETGDLASVGRPIRDAALLPLLELEAADTGFEFDYQVGDTQTDPQAGISAAESLINAGYPSVTGPASSAVNLQVARDVLIPNEVVGISPSSTSIDVTSLDDRDFIYRTAPSDALQGPAIGTIGGDQLGAASASVMFVNNNYGQALTDEFTAGFSGEVTAMVAFEKEQPSYSSRLEEALADDPDMMVIIGYPASGIQIFRDFYADFDSDTDIIVTDGLRDPTLPGEVGSDMTNVIGTAPASGGPGADYFADAFEAEYGNAPGVFTSQAYDATAVAVLANVAAGENSGVGVRDNIRAVANPDGIEYGPAELADAVAAVAAGEAVNYVGASSSVDFDDNGDITSAAYDIFSFTADGVETQSTINFGA